jgi:hypothetical protein
MIEILERDIQKQIIEYLNIRGHYVWRQSVGSSSGESNGKKWFMKFGKKGLADITGIQKGTGKRIEIEVKRPHGKVTKEQMDFIARIQELGGISFIAYSLEDVISRSL